MKSCNTKILELFYNADNTGRIIKPDAIGRFGDNNDGLIIELTWRVQNKVVTDAKFRAFANPNAIAICSVMTKHFIGKTIEDIMNIDEQILKEELGELLPEYLEVYDAVKEAMADAYNNYLKRNNKSVASTNEVVIDVVTAQDSNIDVESLEDDFDDLFEGDLLSKNTPNIDEEQQVFQQVAELISVEKRGRGRPRKPVDENAILQVGEKRGRGRPRKIVDESAIIEPTEKRGRGRPRKPVDENAILQVGEKRGRGRPRKVIDESMLIQQGEKRGRGRPRKPIDENAILQVGEKRGRGRPRKIVDESAIIEPTEKRGRGRPRKPVDENAILQVGEKRGRGRPRKEPFKYNLPSDLDEVIEDEVVESLIGGSGEKDSVNSTETTTYNNYSYMRDFAMKNENQQLEAKPLNNEEEINFDATINNQDVIVEEEGLTNSYLENNAEHQQNVIEGNIISNEVDEDVKRGRGRPRKILDESMVIEEDIKRGRGRPRKEIEQTDEIQQKRGLDRSSTVQLTRSLNPNSQPSTMHSQDIVFASKNVTTTNININVTKTTETNEVFDEYSKNININRVEESSNVAQPTSKLEEVDEKEFVERANTLQAAEFNSMEEDDFEIEEEIDSSKIKDEAPKGGIEDLLKALLEED